MPLALPQYSIIKIDEKEHDIIFHLNTIDKPTHCKFCNQKTIRKYRKRKQFYFDLPIRAKRVGLQIEVQSYLCKECNKSFIEELPKISKERSMTNRLLQYIEEKSLQRPFTHLAEEIGCTEGTIRKIFKLHVATLAEQNKFDQIEAYLQRNDFDFKLFTELDIDPIALENMHFIYNFVTIRRQETVDEIIKNLKNINCISYDDLLHMFSHDPYEKAKYIPYVWYLVLVGKLKIDMSKKISQHTVFEVVK